jgi:hypothetical protein
MLPASPATPAAEPAITIDAALAATYFAELRAISARDDRRLWGLPIDGPMLFVDPSTRAVAANQADAENHLERAPATAASAVFTGILPPDVVVANTAVDWAGVQWTMVMWPLPEDPTDRGVLMAHECWHRMQKALGLPMSNTSSPHLDEMAGRYWLQLEWRALGAALESNSKTQKEHVSDALLFRTYRRSLSSEAAERERALEMNEGLAEYTGVRATLPDDVAAAHYAAAALQRFPRRKSFTRSFAYASGPAYGLLLDGSGASWRHSLQATPDADLGELLRVAMKLGPLASADSSQAAARARFYDDGTLQQSELVREAGRQERLAAYKAKFVDGPVLELPLRSPSSSFDPNQVFPFPGTGSVYGFLLLHDDWGTLEAEEGALMSADFKRVTLAAPQSVSDSTVAGDGWKLSIAKAWRLAPGSRPGDFTLIRKP